MSLATLNRTYSNWKIISGSAIAEDDLQTMEACFSVKKDLPDFPYLILCDHMPGGREIDSILQPDDLYVKKARPVILALKKRNGKELNGYLKLIQSGIDDIIEWNEPEEVINYLEAKYQRYTEVKDVLHSALIKENLIGESKVWQEFLSDIIEATLYSQASILLTGESGTGKELVSQLIHTLDKRENKKRLIIVDCTTIVPELSGSELFGHERGSYTSAVQAREGAFALANGGTLFLDEVGELPLTLQAELLRVLQEGTYKKVGSNNWQKTNFRLVCATNKDLRNAMQEGKFRSDLYYRIADCEYHLPSLEQRKDDVPVLVNYFLSKLFSKENCPEVDKLVMDYLVQRNYPGNVRELRQLVNRIALRHVKHNKITIGEVPPGDRNTLCPAEIMNGDNIQSNIRKALLSGENWWNLKNKISETAIQVALDLEGNNKQRAAERLGIDVRTVQQYVKKKVE